MAITFFLTVAGVVAGLLIGYFYANNRNSGYRTALVSQRDVLQSQVASLQAEVANARDAAAREKVEMQQQCERRVDEAKADAQRQLAEVERRYERQLAEFRAQQDRLAEQQKAHLKQQSDLISERLKSASEEILQRRSDQLSATNKEQLAAILNPLHENLRQMREAVEKSDREQTTTMERLDQSIKENLRQAKEVGERADKLAQALTSENKTQGNFGELRLRTLLENMGLEEGTQFEEQVTMRDADGTTLHEEDGHRLVPDVILHFPDNRDVVIDSKMSLKAFADYHEAATPEAREEALARHIASVRNHVRELARKNYSSYIRKGNNKADFVVMYVYSESALQLAVANAPELWKEAYDQNVIISGSQNLYMMLRVLEMTWRQVRQVENQDKMIDAANDIISRVQLFYERFLRADEQLVKAQKAFDALRTSTSPSGMSIVTAANRLVKFGAKEDAKRKYKLPKTGEETETLPEGEE